MTLNRFSPHPLVFALVCLGFISGVTAGSPETLLETRRYQEQTGELTRIRDWKLSRVDEARLASSKIGDEQYWNHVSPTGDTLGWRAETPTLKIEAIRAGDALVIRGTQDGQPIEKRLKWPDRPWFQSISYSLEQFARGEKKAVKFVTLHPTKFKWIKLRAAREGIEMIQLNGQTIPARRISLRLDGWRAAFWSADYWFRASDGCFLRYKGTNGPPGTPETMVENLSAAKATGIDPNA